MLKLGIATFATECANTGVLYTVEPLCNISVFTYFIPVPHSGEDGEQLRRKNPRHILQDHHIGSR